MTKFTIHDKGSAPEKSIPQFEAALQEFGFIPNLIGVLAESPAALEAYLTLDQLLGKSSFSPVERQVLTLSVSRYNECDYCMAALSAVAEMQNVPQAVIDAIRNDCRIPDEKLAALNIFATEVADKRGWVSEAELDAFLDAGYTRAQILEVILAVTYKTLSNYVNHIAKTPVDKVFEGKVWTAPAKAAVA